MLETVPRSNFLEARRIARNSESDRDRSVARRTEFEGRMPEMSAMSIPARRREETYFPDSNQHERDGAS